MPYTPPALNSPSASYQSSPTRSPGPRPNLPRSNSSTLYLSKHRRSPSWQGQSPAGRTTSDSHESSSTSIHQSPTPRSDSSMPPGAMISPPDSTQNSSDDDEPVCKGSHEVDALQELEEAVRLLDMKWVPGSPPNGQAGENAERKTERKTEERKKVDLRIEMPRTESQGPSFLQQPHPPTPPRLSASARKISHSRSATESSIFDFRNSQSADASLAGSDDSDEEGEDGSNKPALLRKKSGELVKPAIRPYNRRKHSSMPGTPTYSKAVHFNDDIEQVKHFLQVDKPIAVSAGTSPVGGFQDETEFPFGYGQTNNVEWDMQLSNFPRETFERLSQPIRLERMFLSPDQKSLVGIIAVANLAFHKQVVARFTLDQWQTTSEVTAEFNDDVGQKSRDDGYDQFKFSIKISDLANLDSKTMFICLRYNVNGQEYWDNNNSTNYQVDFGKKSVTSKPISAKQATHSLPIPRSKRNSSSSRPRSVPSFDEDFANSFDPNSIIRFRSGTPSKTDLPETTPPRRQAPSGQQFGSRYDFGASLSAALSHAQAQLDESDNMRGYDANDNAEANKRRSGLSGIPPTWSQSLARPGHVPPSNSGTESPRPDALLAKKQPLDSRAYQEFVSKFCFFGSSKSNQSSQAKAQHHGDTDGASDETPTDKPLLTSNYDGTAKHSSTRYEIQQSSTTSSPGSSGDSSPLAIAERIRHQAPSSASWGFPFSSESRPGAFTPESQSTPTAIQG